MIVEILLALLVLGAIASADAYVWASAPRLTSLASFAIWATIGYGATEITVSHEVVESTIETVTVAEPSLALLAFGNAAISFVFLWVSVFGKHPNSSPDDQAIPKGALP